MELARSLGFIIGNDHRKSLTANGQWRYIRTPPSLGGTWHPRDGEPARRRSARLHLNSAAELSEQPEPTLPGTDVFHYWLAEGVGIVPLNIFFDDDDTTMNLERTSWG